MAHRGTTRTTEGHMHSVANDKTQRLWLVILKVFMKNHWKCRIYLLNYLPMWHICHLTWKGKAQNIIFAYKWGWHFDIYCGAHLAPLLTSKCYEFLTFPHILLCLLTPCLLLTVNVKIHQISESCHSQNYLFWKENVESTGFLIMGIDWWGCV